jgi:chaperonin cofactor prefoldin
MNFTEDFRSIFNGLQALQNHLEIELNSLHNRIGYLEEKQNKDDEFFRNLEALIQTRNK